MKRDSSLVRMILEHLEATVTLRDPVFSSQLEFPGYSSEEANEHIAICYQEGLLNVEDVSTFGKTDFLIRGLTAAGRHELERVREGDSLQFKSKWVTNRGFKLVFSLLLVAAAIAAILTYLGIRPLP